MPDVVPAHPSVNKFVARLPESLESECRHALSVIEKFGNHIGFPDVRKIQRDLYEFRITEPEHIRIFYTVQNDTAYILHVFTKKSGKTPRHELRLAQRRLHQLLVKI